MFNSLESWGMFLIIDVVVIKFNFFFNLVSFLIDGINFLNDMFIYLRFIFEVLVGIGIWILLILINILNKCIDCVLFWEVL